jgi:hypothetical protein
VRPWIHTLLHIVNETVSKGPISYYSQWTIERVIGQLEENLRLHSNPFVNLAMIATRTCQANALRSMVPGVVREKPTIYQTGTDLGNGYAAAHPIDRLRKPVSATEAEALQKMMVDNGFTPDHTWRKDHSVLRFGRLALPNGSVARTAWKEHLKPIEHLRTARMVEVSQSLLV